MLEDIIDTVHIDSAVDDTNLQTVYQFSDMWAGVKSIPNRYWIDWGKSFNQYAHEDSKCSCGLYGSRHGINDEKKDYQDPYQYNAECINGRGLSPKTGRSMSLALSYLISKQWISGYTKCSTLQEVKTAIFNDMNIFTGTRNIDFKKMRENGNNIAVKSPWPWHFFEIDWYDDYSQELRVRDSMWEKAWDNWHFYIKYSDFDCLYTCMALVPWANIHQAKIEADKRTIEKAISLKITNGDRLKDPLSRRDGALLVGRIFLQASDDNSLLEQAKIAHIWNGERPNDPILRWELMLMLSGALKIRTNDDNESILNLVKTGITLGQNRKNIATREEGILLVTRAYEYLEKEKAPID